MPFGARKKSDFFTEIVKEHLPYPLNSVVNIDGFPNITVNKNSNSRIYFNECEFIYSGKKKQIEINFEYNGERKNLVFKNHACLNRNSQLIDRTYAQFGYVIKTKNASSLVKICTQKITKDLYHKANEFPALIKGLIEEEKHMLPKT